MNPKSIDFYREFSQYTDPGLYGDLIKDNIPKEVRDLGLLIRKQLIHTFILQNGNTGSNEDLRYGDMARVPWFQQREDDVFVTAASMLAELFRRDKNGLTLERKAEEKLVLSCRSTAVLTASLMKLMGYATRVRSGFADYFVVEGQPKGKSEDHWLNQYWHESQQRWITIDVDGSIEGYLPFDTHDLPDGVFDFSPNAWLKVRKGELSGDHFWNAGGNGGLITIAWELFYDFHCLMNDEINYFHTPEITHFGKFDKLTEQQLSEIDHLAELMQNPDENFKKLHDIWESKREYRLVKGGLR